MAYNRWNKSRRLYGRILQVGPKNEGVYRMPPVEDLTDAEVTFMKEYERDSEFWPLLQKLRSETSS